MKNKEYSISWSAIDDADLTSILKTSYPKILKRVEMISKPEKLPFLDILDVFEGTYLGNKISRPEGSHRAFYLKDKVSEAVMAIKGTEAVSSQLKDKMQKDKNNRLPHRPWSKFENFIYREQKAPLAMLFNEARDEANIGVKYQVSSFKNFGFFEEAPLPLLVFKWSNKVTEAYINTISPYLDNRAKNLLFPLIETYGLGGTVYHYPYLPTRIRFSGKQTIRSTVGKGRGQLLALDNLINIVARMLLIDFLPFDFEDHGIGQCVAPQNVTLRGGICDLGSIKKINEISKDRTYILLQSLGTILSRTATEIFGSSISDTFYEFENPTTLQHFLSAVIHEKLYSALSTQSQVYSLKIRNELRSYYDFDNKTLIKVLGLK